MSPTSENTASIIVTFWADANFEERLARVSQQVGLVVVVDNTPAPHAAPCATPARGLNVDLIHNKENLGLAAGLNQGVRHAIAKGFQWVLLLDQDTLVDPDLLSGLREVHERLPEKDMVGIIAANARMPPSNRLMEADDGSDEPYMEKATVITSGSLLATHAFARAGPFREDFFIEGVDLEYCLRLRRAGYRIMCSRRPLMLHAAGEMKEARWLWKRVPLTHHAAWRYKFMARNLVLIMKEYYRQEPTWVMRSALNFSKTTVKMLLYEGKRIEKLSAIIAGVSDGLTRTHPHDSRS